MMRNSGAVISLRRRPRPATAKVDGHAVAGGAEIALCAHPAAMAQDATIGCMPARVSGCATPAVRVCRLGAAGAERTPLAGDGIDRRKAGRAGLIRKAVPAGDLDVELGALAARRATAPADPLMRRKPMTNPAVEAAGPKRTRMLPAPFDGVARPSPERMAFRRRAECLG